MAGQVIGTGPLYVSWNGDWVGQSTTTTTLKTWSELKTAGKTWTDMKATGQTWAEVKTDGVQP